MSTRSGLAALAGSFVLAVGCTGGEPEGPLDPIDPPVRRVDLRAAMGPADVSPVGVAVDPTGARFVFDEQWGLYRIGAGGVFELVMALDAMPTPSVPVRPPFTDLVAGGPDRFAITALGDGFLLDVALGTMNQYFCYVPDGLPEPYDQRTDAITYDPVARLLYAQPRTVDENGGLIGSSIASYSVETGRDLEWFGVPTEIAAGGMAKLPGVDGLVLGNGGELLRFDGRVLVPFDDLRRFGVQAVAGLAVDATAGTLLVLDGPGDALVEIELADLGR